MKTPNSIRDNLKEIQKDLSMLIDFQEDHNKVFSKAFDELQEACETFTEYSTIKRIKNKIFKVVETSKNIKSSSQIHEHEIIKNVAALTNLAKTSSKQIDSNTLSPSITPYKNY